MPSNNLFPKDKEEPIEAYTLRLRAAITNPDSTLWKRFRSILGLTKREWLNSFPKPDCVFPYPHTRWDINCGHCETIADLLEINFPGGESFWLDEFYLNDKRTLPNNFSFRSPQKQEAWCSTNTHNCPAHCVYKFQGRIYDSDTPHGVTDWMKLPCWKNRKLTRNDWITKCKLRK